MTFDIPAAGKRRMTDGGTAMPEFYWHVHHDTLLEPLAWPIEKRITYIKANKPEDEVPIRLRWLTPVQGELPSAYLKAGVAYVKAGVARDKAAVAYDKVWAAHEKAKAAREKAAVAYDKACAAYDKAGAAYVKAGATALPALEALHAIEHPGCPWNGETLLP